MLLPGPANCSGPLEAQWLWRTPHTLHLTSALISLKQSLYYSA